MSKIYNKHMDQVIRSVEPTFGQEKTKAFKRNLESKKMFKKGVIDPTLKAEEVRKYKAKGGRIGLKSGTNPFARKSNIFYTDSFIHVSVYLIQIMYLWL